MSPIPLAFYAPLKPPDHPNPSGDRHLAQLLMKALGLAGFEVQLASRFRSRDGTGDLQRQLRLQRIGERLALRLIRHYSKQSPARRPKIWFTYHLYHKAPDWIGPAVARALRIPYVVAEASYAPKQQQGPWASGLQASLQALTEASAILCLNPVDRACIADVLPGATIHALPPFLDLQSLPLQSGAGDSKARLARHWKLDPQRPWLCTVAMMRPGDKAESYRLLASALKQLRHSNWQLLVVGDGQAAPEIRQEFQGLDNVRFLGKLSPEAFMPLLSHCDLYVWPAVNEAFGLSLLEAQAAGTPVLAGNEGGVASIVRQGVTAELSEPRDAKSFSRKLELLLADPQRLQKMGIEARLYVFAEHGLNCAASRLRTLLEPLLEPLSEPSL